MFKARDKSNPKKFVAMKKVLMDNEKEGVSIYHYIKNTNPLKLSSVLILIFISLPYFDMLECITKIIGTNSTLKMNV